MALYDEKGYVDRVLELCEARLRVAPSDVDALLRCAEINSDIGSDDVGAVLLERAAAAAPNDRRVANSRAQFYYRFRQFDKAVASLKPLVAKNPNDDSLLYQYSEYLRGMENWDLAEERIKAAIKLKPDKGLYHRQLAHILVTSGRAARFAEAEREARKAIELGDNDIDARYWLAMAIDKQQKRQETIKAYEDVVREDAQYETAAYRLGRLYQEIGKVSEGQELLKLFGEMERNRSQFTQALRNLRKDRGRKESYLTLADRFPDGQEGLAVAVLRRGLSKFPNDADLKRKLRETLESCGRQTEAKLIL